MEEAARFYPVSRQQQECGADKEGARMKALKVADELLILFSILSRTNGTGRRPPS